MVEVNQKLSPATVLQITNSLRIVGLKSSHKGTKLINKSIQYILVNDIEFFTLEEIYQYLHITYNSDKHTIKSNINNALTNRNKKQSETNFEKIFNYQYDVSIFQPKIFIEELTRTLL